MTDILDAVAPALLPARTAPMKLSTDNPSGGEVRPFGLTRSTALADNEAMVSLDGAIYDRDRQLNIDHTGIPYVDTPKDLPVASVYDTQYDMQWFVDKD